MSMSVQAGTALSLDQFWRWLKEHANCIVQVGTPDCYLYDHADLHWHLGEDADRNLWIQMMWGKQTMGELLIEPGRILYVQAAPDLESGESGRFSFELIGGSKEEAYPLYHFIMAHGFDESSNQHGPLKH